MALRPRQVPRVGNQRGLPIVVTEVQHGAVDTAMRKPESPLLCDVRRVLVASPTQAAKPDPPSCSEPDEARHVTKRCALLALRLCTECDLPSGAAVVLNLHPVALCLLMLSAE